MSSKKCPHCGCVFDVELEQGQGDQILPKSAAGACVGAGSVFGGFSDPHNLGVEQIKRAMQEAHDREQGGERTKWRYTFAGQIAAAIVQNNEVHDFNVGVDAVRITDYLLEALEAIPEKKAS